MNNNQTAKLNRFINDLEMQNAVHTVLRDAFLSKKGQKDVQILAAERLAVDFLDDAWKTLERYKDIQEVEQTKSIKYV